VAAVELMADLDAFLAEKGALPWAWGTVDCCMVLADWSIANGREDLLARYRGAYDDAESCRRIVIERGGLLPLISDQCAQIGLAAVEAPARGAIAVIGSRLHPLRQWGAIHDGDRWRVRTADGFASVTARPLGVWSV
jgi:hypothetical protein